MHLFLSSQDSNQLHTENTWNDFKVTLPYPIYLDRGERWECGLCNVSIKSMDHSRIAGAECVNVFCDVIESSVVYGSVLPMLQSAPLKDVRNKITTFDPIFYFDVTRERIDTIRIYLTLDKRSVSSLGSAVTKCTLHLRRA